MTIDWTSIMSWNSILIPFEQDTLRACSVSAYKFYDIFQISIEADGCRDVNTYLTLWK